MSTQPLVSVIIPTFNRAKVISSTLESVLAQTYPRVEIIVIDDGSSDDTAAVIAGYGDRVRYHRQQNQGVERARSRGIRLAQGEFINFLDDDDLMQPEKLARQVELFQQRPTFGIVHCGYDYIDKNGVLLETTGRLPEGDVRKNLAWGCFPWSGGPLVRRECLNLIGEDEHRDWYGDWGMWLRVALAGYHFGCVQEPLGAYRIVPGSMTDDKVANAERLVFHILDEIFTHYDLPPEAHAESDAIYAGWHFWITCRYYVGGFYTEGQRSLTHVLERRPALLDKPDDLLQMFYWDALSPRGRVGDPIGFIQKVFDHLPEAALPLKPLRGRLLAQAHSGLALFDYGAGRLTEGQRHLSDALRHDPAHFDQPERFMQALRDCAGKMRLESPADYVNRVFQHLPAQATGLARMRGRVLAETQIARAFRDYEAGQRSGVPGQVLSAVRHQPALLKNRGVLLIFLKSLPALVRG
jgi:glycosyltransferase involved in cell wall biosynthesis